MIKFIEQGYAKMFEVAILLIVLPTSQAENIEKYYNYKWKECAPNEARFLSLIKKTDTCFNRTDYFIHEKTVYMSGSYEDVECKIPTGHFVYCYANKAVESTGYFEHGKKEGTWVSYYSNRNMRDSCYYLHGNKSGISLGWYPNAFMKDSIVTNPDGSGIEVNWFDNGALSTVGRYSSERKKEGKWKYFHFNGKLSSLETYHEGNLITKKYYDEQGNMMNDTLNIDKLPVFPGGIKGWQKYIEKGLYFPPGYKIINGDRAAVVVSFIVNIEGNIEEINITTPFSPVFDKIVEHVIKKSPKWSPAIQHNRRVPCSFTMPVVFANWEDN